MDIAEQIITNGSADGDLVQDDLGFLVERDIADHPTELCRYMLVRILKRKGRPYTHGGALYIGGELIGYGEEPRKDFPTLALRYIDSTLPVRLTQMQIQWLYNRLFDLAAPLNDDLIQVGTNLFFNVERGEFEYDD